MRTTGRQPRCEATQEYTNVEVAVDPKAEYDQALAYLLYRAMAMVRPCATAHLRQLGMGLPEFVCLHILATTSGRTNADLARDVNVSAQAMNRVVHALQQIGAVARPRGASLSRGIPVRLTAKGAEMLRRSETALIVAEQPLLADMKDSERREFKRLLRLAIGGAGEDS